MHYISTRNNKIKESFLNILFQGLSKDGGLFLPSSWPLVSIESIKRKTYQEIAYTVISPYVNNDVSDDELILILDKTYKNFHHESVAPSPAFPVGHAYLPQRPLRYAEALWGGLPAVIH